MNYLFGAIFCVYFLTLSTACGTSLADKRADAVAAPKSDIPTTVAKHDTTPAASKLDTSAPAPKRDTPTKILKDIEMKYSSARSVQMSVKKEVMMPAMKRTRTYEGTLIIKPKGRFKFELTKPSRSLVIVDSQKVWIVDYPADPTIDNVVRVISSKEPQKMQSPVLVTFLMGKGSLLDHFKIEKQTVVGPLVQFDLKPKEAEGDVKKLRLTVNSGTKLISTIEYTDQIDNKVRFVFDNVEFGKPVLDAVFKFTPPKGAEITEM